MPPGEGVTLGDTDQGSPTVSCLPQASTSLLIKVRCAGLKLAPAGSQPVVVALRIVVSDMGENRTRLHSLVR